MNGALHTTGEVIDALDGTGGTARLLGYTPQRVCNYRSREKFPITTFEAITEELRKRGLRADPALWPDLPASLAQELAASLG